MTLIQKLRSGTATGGVAWLASGYGPQIAFAPDDEGAGGGDDGDGDDGADDGDDDDADNASGDDDDAKGGDDKSSDKGGDDDGKSVLTRGKKADDEDGDKSDKDGKKSDDKDGKSDKDGEKPVVPEKYELEMPDGTELDEAALERFTPAFKELNLTNDQVQKLANLRLEEQEASAQQWVDTRKSWVESGKKDADIGGDKYDASVKTAQTAIGQFADDEAVKFLEDSGLGDHPAMLRMFHRIGAAMADDSFVTSRGGSDGDSQAARLNRLYPTMNKG